MHSLVVPGARVVLLALTAVTLCSTAQSAHAEWPPRDPWKPQARCGPNYEPPGHRQGRCGWHTVPVLIGRVFTVGTTRARCVVWRESRNDPRATNGQYRGLWQFGSGWYAGKFDPYSPVASTLRAWAATRHGTYWAPWYPLGRC